MMQEDEKLGLYDYVGECKGNNGNSCFIDSCGHNCGCFKRVKIEETIYTEEEVLTLLTNFVVNINQQQKLGVLPLRIKEWLEETKIYKLKKK